MQVACSCRGKAEIKRDFFICWITLPADMKSWDFEKKKKKQQPDFA